MKDQESIKPLIAAVYELTEKGHQLVAAINQNEAMLRQLETLRQRPACILRSEMRSQVPGISSCQEAARVLTETMSDEDLLTWVEETYQRGFGELEKYQALDGSRSRMIDYIVGSYL